MKLLRKQTALAWDLRGYLWGGREIIVTLRQDALVPRYRGFLVDVSPTDATARLDDARWDEPVLIPLDLVLTVRSSDYLEHGPAPVRQRPIFAPSRGPEAMPGQLLLGGDPPPVSRRTLVAMQRAAGMLLSQDLLDVLGALDRAAKGKQSVSTTDVADAMTVAVDAAEVGEKPSIQWTVRRLTALAGLRLAFVVRERPYSWAPGE